MSSYIFGLCLAFCTSIACAQECDPSTIKNRYVDQGTEIDKFAYDLYTEQLDKEILNRQAQGSYGPYSGLASERNARIAQRIMKSSIGITHEEWRNYAAWYWSRDALQAYQSCLDAFTRVAGLHPKVVDADAREVIVVVKYLAGPNDPRMVKLEIVFLSGGTASDLPNIVMGAGTTSSAVMLRRESRRPLRVQFKAGNYVSEPILIPAYVRIVLSTQRTPFTSAPVHAYCPLGSGVAAGQCFDAPRDGQFEDVDKEIIVNRDERASVPHKSQRFEFNISENRRRVCANVHCNPKTNKGSEIKGRIRAWIVSTVYTKQYD